MPWNGSGSTVSGIAELMSISLLKPSARRKYVRVQPSGSGSSSDASNVSATSSPSRAMTNMSSAPASSSSTSPSRV